MHMQVHTHALPRPALQCGCIISLRSKCASEMSKLYGSCLLMSNSQPIPKPHCFPATDVKEGGWFVCKLPCLLEECCQSTGMA